MFGDRFFATQNELIERNIIPYAASEFESLIEKFGNIRGPLILKNVLDLNVKALSEEEMNDTQAMFISLLEPKETMAKARELTTVEHIFISDENLRAVFAARLLLLLQEHYLNCERSANEDEFKAIEWIPDWTKRKAERIRAGLLDVSPKSAHEKKTKALLHGTLIFMSLFLYMSAQDKYAKAGLTCLLLFTLRCAFNEVIGDEIKYKIDNKFGRERHEKRSGKHALTILDKIVDQKFGILSRDSCWKKCYFR